MMASDPMALSQPQVVIDGSEQLAVTNIVEMFSICHKWVMRQIHVDSNASCCTATERFLEGTDRDKGLSAEKGDHECLDPDHIGRIHLQVRAVGSDDQDCIIFCVVDDETPVAVMTGNEPCFDEIFEGETLAPLAMKPMTKRE
jgi:hypothetical protein